MTTLLLSPHNDDEALFASYICLREKPRVVVALDGSLKRHGPTPQQRAEESAAAMEVLGCEFEHLGFPVDLRDWEPIRERLAQEEPSRVWAPFPEPDGHRHHNALARTALSLWGAARVSFYTTYRLVDGWPVRTTTPEPIQPKPGWEELKRQALACYPSQAEQPGTAMHFERPLDEYEVPTLRLNLGGGLNPIDGFVNLDKTNGWLFESGLPDYPDGSVEAVTESHALMYVDEDVWPFVFGEIARVLRPGGTVRITEDAIGEPGSGRPVIRKRAKVATDTNLIMRHLYEAGLNPRKVEPNETYFVDRSLIQCNYGDPPDVTHVEATKPL